MEIELHGSDNRNLISTAKSMEINESRGESEDHRTVNVTTSSNNLGDAKTVSKTRRFSLLALNVILLIVGASGSPLILRIYFIHGGSRKWFSACLQTAGFPFLLIPLLFSFLHKYRRNRRPNGSHKLFSLSPRLLLYSTVIGIITGIDDFFYSYGISYLPVSTSSLLISTQLGFTALFAFFIVRQKFTASSINAVVLLTFGSVVLAVDANGDRPAGESSAKFYIGFVMTLAAAALYGLVLPLVELAYAKAKQAVTYTVVMEVQLIIGIFATVVCAVGMAINNDFQLISKEAETYGLGKAKYYLVVVFTTVITQFFFLGLVGTIKYSSALLAGIIIAVGIPVTEVLAIFFFHEKFDGEKGVALALSLWGSASYFYGEYKEYQRRKAIAMEARLPVSVPLTAECEMK
ncbi:Purine permease 3 [Apostasia shenzhenica]|uniref:Probable purine permease n=1 Tax=Apostasia shenzhenica TaxID=1088818 RepID=A0A2H9ZSJ1_9ASPA|nr:Purine permease 3 [Apostasia shenzhenica]